MARPKKVVSRSELWRAVSALVTSDAAKQLDALEDEQARSIGATLFKSLVQAEELAWQLVERERELMRGR